MARQELSVFFQRLKTPQQPAFVTEQCGEMFKCTIKVPAIGSGEINAVGCDFVGVLRLFASKL